MSCSRTQRNAAGEARNLQPIDLESSTLPHGPTVLLNMCTVISLRYVHMYANNYKNIYILSLSGFELLYKTDIFFFLFFYIIMNNMKQQITENEEDLFINFGKIAQVPIMTLI